MKRAINNDVQVGSGTYIGCGMEMALDLLSNRRTKNPLSALLLLTDGQDTRPHDYSQLMQRLPENTPCHTFGYGRDHETSLLIQLAEQGNGGTFTYIVSSILMSMTHVSKLSIIRIKMKQWVLLLLQQWLVY